MGKQLNKTNNQMKQELKLHMRKKSLATPFDHIPITATFDETYYNFEDH